MDDYVNLEIRIDALLFKKLKRLAQYSSNSPEKLLYFAITHIVNRYSYLISDVIDEKKYRYVDGNNLEDQMKLF